MAEGRAVYAVASVRGPVAESVAQVGDAPPQPVVFDPGGGAVPALCGALVGWRWTEQVGEVAGRCGSVAANPDRRPAQELVVELLATAVQIAELAPVGGPS